MSSCHLSLPKSFSVTFREPELSHNRGKFSVLMRFSSNYLSWFANNLLILHPICHMQDFFVFFINIYQLKLSSMRESYYSKESLLSRTLMLLALLLTFGWSGAKAEGSGTADDPYVIKAG